MRARLTVLCFLSLSIYCFLPQLSLAQQLKVMAPHKPVGPKLAKRLPLPPPVPGSMVGGPWVIDGNFKSSIYLKNGVETDPVTITPVLYLSNGVRYTLPDVQLEPSGTAVVDLNAALQSLGIAPYATLSGYVEIDYNWPWDPICATIRNLDVAHSLLFTYNLRSTKLIQLPNQPPLSSAPMTNVVEGMWWKQEPNVTGFVALANTTSRPLTARVTVSDGLGNTLKQHTVEVSPHGMKMVNLDELASATSAEGGIRITYIGQMSDLVINGGLEDQALGYSVGLPLTLVPMASNSSKATIAELGLMTGTADPMMQFPAGITFTPYTIVRNISNRPLTATPTVWWMAGGAAQSFQLPNVSLPPYQCQTLKVPALLAAAGLKNLAGTVHLVFDVQENADGLLLAGGSVDQTSNYVFAITPHGITESGARSLSYWSTANGDDTMVTLWNPADEVQDFLFTVAFSGGQYQLPIHLEPRATRIFNMSEVGQIPDAEGNVIPGGIHEGGAKISGTQGDNESILVAMDAGTYNVRKATCGQFCHGCLGEVSHTITPSTFSVAVAGQQQLNFYAVYNNGQHYADAGTWSTSDGSIATVDQNSGLVTGVSGGSATITAQASQDADPQFVSSWCEGVHWACPLNYIGGSANSSGTVFNVQITSSDIVQDQITVVMTPNSVNGTLTLTANGAGFSTTLFQGLESGNTINFSFNRPQLVSGQYTYVKATWYVAGYGTATATSTDLFEVLGIYRHSQYNVPYESACTGSAATAWVISGNCAFTQTTLRSDFMTQLYINGTGISLSHGILKYTTQCSNYPSGANSQNSFVQVSQVTGSCNSILVGGSTVAAYPNPPISYPTWVCGDLLEYVTSSDTNQAQKAVQDYCPACNSGFNGTSGHIDDFSSSTACSGHAVGDYGNYLTIRLR
jgi:uncharacterized protein YjdB